MKTPTILFKQNLLAFLFLISIVCIPCTTFGIEPIGTIGQPIPEQHAFLNNETILRVVPTHIQVVDTNTGEVLDEFGKRTNRNPVVFSPSASHLAIMNYSTDTKTTSVNIWDANAGQLISQWEIAARISDDAVFSPTQPIFAIPIAREIHFWDWQNGEFIGKLVRENMPSDRAMVFSTDGRHLIVVANRSNFELWNVETRSLEAQFGRHSIGSVGELVISPDGKYIAMFALNSNVIYVWDLETQQQLWQKWNSIGNIASMAFSPDSQRLYVGNKWGVLNSQRWNDQVRVWDIESGEQVDVFETGFNFLNTLALSPDGKTFLLNYWDVEVLWDIEKKQQLSIWHDYISGWDIALSPDGQTLVSVSLHFIKTWDVASQQMRLLVSSEDGFFRKFAISPDGQKLAIGIDPWIQVRNMQTGKVESQFTDHFGIGDYAFSKTGRWIAVEDWGNIAVYDLKAPVGDQKLTLHKKPRGTSGNWVTFSDNDEYIVAANKRNNAEQVFFWKRKEDTFVFHFSWQVPPLYQTSSSGFAVDANGSLLLALRGDNDLQIWKFMPDAPQLVATLPRVGYPVHFSPEGRYLLLGQDDDLQIWDWQTETQLDHPVILDYFDLSQNGEVLASYDDSGQIHIWDATQLLPSQPQTTAVEPKGKKIVTLGQIKRNQLLQNFPNPFNPETWIPFRLADKSRVTIRIYTPTGKLVRSLSPGIISAGNYTSQSQAIHWDGRNDKGEPVSSGVYLYTISAGDFSATRKMLIQK
jgi:WD40 repeat protein